jgi:tRNA threonylcarbamoyladenosine biosynthesis protein TsaB
LMPLIARVMDRAQLEFAELDRIAVTVGPGSFTGLRVGISAARGIALVSGKPAVGISTLSAYAAPQVANEDDAAIVAAIDARHDHVYLQVFANSGRTLWGPALASIAEAVQVGLASPSADQAGPAGPAGLADEVGAAGLAGPRLVGSAAQLVAAQWPSAAPPPRLVDPRGAPPIDWVARLGSAVSRTDVPPTPLYLRAPDARPQDRARLPRR